MGLRGEWNLEFFEDGVEVGEGLRCELMGEWGDIRVGGMWEMEGEGKVEYREEGFGLGMDVGFVGRDKGRGGYEGILRVREGWEGKERVIKFEGVERYFEVYVKGEYVGLRKGSGVRGEFEMRGMVKRGEKVLCVGVMEWGECR